jgi:hypothetical protein
MRIAKYLSVSSEPDNPLNPLKGENDLAKDEIPLRLLRRSDCAAGSTDAVALYSLGVRTARRIAPETIIEMKKNKNFRNFAIVYRKSKNAEPTKFSFCSVGDEF